AFMDEFRFNKVFSSIDRGGRYAYNQQPLIVQWNLARLAECLLGIDSDQAGFEWELGRFDSVFEPAYRRRMASKLGFESNDTEADATLIRDLLLALEQAELDYTLSFRQLADRLVDDDAPLLGEPEINWRVRVLANGADRYAIREAMNRINPIVIPRNHQIERAIQSAMGGDLSVFNELAAALAEPYRLQPGLDAYASAPEPSERVVRTFCGT
ncbi:MAG: protein adenylyltransferase SelO family protein, partial [Pseudomonadota bacterium]